MKKLLVVLALILLAVSPLFAQDTKGEFKWSGMYFGSWRLDGGSGDPVWYMNVNYLANTFSFTAQTYGVVAALYFDNNTLFTTDVYDGSGTSTTEPTAMNNIVWLDQVYGYATLFSGFLKITMGFGLIVNYSPVPLASYTILNGNYGIGLNQYDYDWNYYGGAVFEFMFTKELNASVYLAKADLENLDTVPATLPPTIQEYLDGGGVEFAIKYNVEKIGIIAAGYIPNSLVTMFWASFYYNGTENLVAQVKFESVELLASVISGSISYKLPIGLTLAQDVEMTLPEVGDSSFELTTYVRYNTDFGRVALHFQYLTLTEEYTVIPELRFDTGDVTNRIRFYLWSDNTWRLRYDFMVSF